MLKEGAAIYAYPYSGYWMDVGTIESYWQAHMDLLADPPPLNLNDRGWVIHTRTEERPPMRIASGNNHRRQHDLRRLYHRSRRTGSIQRALARCDRPGRS